MARKKVRSERQPGTGIAHARELLAAVVPDARWRLMFARMSEIASGDGPVAAEAAELLESYAFARQALEVPGADG